MKGHSLWQILGRDLPIRVKFLVINFLVMATTLIVSAILILRASTAVRENTLSETRFSATGLPTVTPTSSSDGRSSSGAPPQPLSRSAANSRNTTQF